MEKPDTMDIDTLPPAEATSKPEAEVPTESKDLSLDTAGAASEDVMETSVAGSLAAQEAKNATLEEGAERAVDVPLSTAPAGVETIASLGADADTTKPEVAASQATKDAPVKHDVKGGAGEPVGDDWVEVGSPDKKVD
jgi:hypothetical protein